MTASATRKPLPAARKQPVWDLRLYVVDQSRRCVTAFANLKNVCEEHLPGQYRIDVIDVLAHSDVARTEQIVVIPTAVRRSPKPVRTAIGDLSDIGHVLAWLGLAQHN